MVVVVGLTDLALSSSGKTDRVGSEFSLSHGGQRRRVIRGTDAPFHTLYRELIVLRPKVLSEGGKVNANSYLRAHRVLRLFSLGLPWRESSSQPS